MPSSTRFKLLASASAALLALSVTGAARADVVSEMATPEASDTIYVNTPNTQERDRQLTQKVSAILAADPRLKGEMIAVSTRNGVLRLSGELSSVSMIYRTIETVRKVPGVGRINDNELM